VVDSLGRMGQALFSPPNVKGWRTGTDWLNSATLLARNNFAETVAMGTWSSGGRPVPLNRFEVARPTKIDEPRSANTAPPPPDVKYDVCELVYAAKPKDIAAVVKRLGELLYGDATPPAVAKKIETFLLTPASKVSAVQPGDPGGLPPGAPPKKEGVRDLPPGAPQPKQPAKKEPAKKEPPPKPLDPKDVKIDSPEFKSRVREAAHAMMCLPEYQLN
jgi:hypothetical protein